jgi:hypothetical protein
MGSIVMDRNQNIALGYSRSSSELAPDIAYAGRLGTDPLGTLQTETIVPLPSTANQSAAVRRLHVDAGGPGGRLHVLVHQPMSGGCGV